MNMKFIASYWLACLLACSLLLRLLFNYFLLLYSAGGMGRVNWKATLSLKTRRRSPKTVAKRKFHLLAVNPLGKNVVSIAQHCTVLVFNLRFKCEQMLQGLSIAPTLAHWPSTYVGTCVQPGRYLATLHQLSEDLPSPDLPRALGTPVLGRAQVHHARKHVPTLDRRSLPRSFCKPTTANPAKKLPHLRSCSCEWATTAAVWSESCERHVCQVVAAHRSNLLEPKSCVARVSEQRQEYLGGCGRKPCPRLRTPRASSKHHPRLDTATWHISSSGIGYSKQIFPAKGKYYLVELVWLLSECASQIVGNCRVRLAAKCEKKPSRYKLKKYRWYGPCGRRVERSLVGKRRSTGMFSRLSQWCPSCGMRDCIRPYWILMINGNFSFSWMAPFTQRKNATACAKNSFDHGPCSGVKILDPQNGGLKY